MILPSREFIKYFASHFALNVSEYGAHTWIQRNFIFQNYFVPCSLFPVRAPYVCQLNRFTSQYTRHTGTLALVNLLIYFFHPFLSLSFFLSFFCGFFPSCRLRRATYDTRNRMNYCLAQKVYVFYSKALPQRNSTLVALAKIIIIYFKTIYLCTALETVA